MAFRSALALIVPCAVLGGALLARVACSTSLVRDWPPVKVYVYDDPAFNQADLISCHIASKNTAPWQDERFDMAQNMAEIWMHKALLVHPWRVLDPDDADLFYVPVYPVLSYANKNCGGMTHLERMTKAVSFLTHKSKYFQRFAGTDHVFVCSWWSCKSAFGRHHRMLLRHALLGINDVRDWWAEWGCLGRNITVPYVASSSITSIGVVGGLSPEDRTVPFYFVGTARGRPEREHLHVGRCI